MTAERRPEARHHIRLDLSTQEACDIRDCIADRIERLDALRADPSAEEDDLEYARDEIADLTALDRMVAAALR